MCRRLQVVLPPPRQSRSACRMAVPSQMEASRQRCPKWSAGRESQSSPRANLTLSWGTGSHPRQAACMTTCLVRSCHRLFARLETSVTCRVWDPCLVVLIAALCAQRQVLPCPVDKPILSTEGATVLAAPVKHLRGHQGVSISRWVSVRLIRLALFSAAFEPYILFASDFVGTGNDGPSVFHQLQTHTGFQDNDLFFLRCNGF
mmetsp:Transcript_46846/g.124445  ORF Transcript_46846/g.124445 Transcript_46846/m.124445 type:complete len:203 (-) Transcript_46846:43-651(-)